MDTKRCYICLRTKPFSDFLNHNSKKDGKRAECRDCGREIKREQRKNWTPEQKRRARKRPAAIRAKKRQRKGATARAAARARESRKYHSNPEYRKKVLEKLQRSKTPEKNKARRALGFAVAEGKIQKQPCVCGATRVQGHHEDYSKPLEVIWMCASCHSKLHRQKQLMNLDSY